MLTDEQRAALETVMMSHYGGPVETCPLDEKLFLGGIAFERERNKWQNIDAAPKDGTIVLLANADRMLPGYWGDDEDGEWYDTAGYRWGDPSDFQPLPEPPQ